MASSRAAGVIAPESAIWPLRRWIKRLARCLRMALLATNDHADLRMRMQRRNARYSATAGADLPLPRIVDWPPGIGSGQRCARPAAPSSRGGLTLPNDAGGDPAAVAQNDRVGGATEPVPERLIRSAVKILFEDDGYLRRRHGLHAGIPRWRSGKRTRGSRPTRARRASTTSRLPSSIGTGNGICTGSRQSRLM